MNTIIFWILLSCWKILHSGSYFILGRILFPLPTLEYFYFSRAPVSQFLSIISRMPCGKTKIIIFQFLQAHSPFPAFAFELLSSNNPLLFDFYFSNALFFPIKFQSFIFFTLGRFKQRLNIRGHNYLLFLQPLEFSSSGSLRSLPPKIILAAYKNNL